MRALQNRNCSMPVNLEKEGPLTSGQNHPSIHTLNSAKSAEAPFLWAPYVACRLLLFQPQVQFCAVKSRKHLPKCIARTVRLFLKPQTAGHLLRDEQYSCATGRSLFRTSPPTHTSPGLGSEPGLGCQAFLLLPPCSLWPFLAILLT